ncbi:MAG: FAD-binding oxidoreductase [Bacillota bacterium]|nr:FAD-binding oxidoreductase [Bacillota bacterium]
MEENQIIAPADIASLQAIIKKANEENTNIILKDNLSLNKHILSQIRSNAIILDLSNMNGLLELDRENLTVSIEAGINFHHFQNLIAKEGFLFPLDNYTSAFTTLGYNVLHGFPAFSKGKYGSFREYVLGLEAVTYDGTIVSLGGKNIKNVSGLDIIGLLQGSKERLAIITKLVLRLLPLPETKVLVITPFDNLQSAIEATTNLTLSGSIPAKLQVVSEHIYPISEVVELPNQPLVIAEFDGFKASLPEQLEKYKEIVKNYCKANSIIISSSEDINQFWLEFSAVICKTLLTASSKVNFSCNVTELQQLLVQLEKRNTPFPACLINGTTATGMFISTENLNYQDPQEWLVEVTTAINSNGGVILNNDSFISPGLNAIYERLLNLFDPNKVSFFAKPNEGGAYIESESDKLYA